MPRLHDQVESDEWVSFPGGELEGKRPKALCPVCRERLKREAAARLLPTSGSQSSARPLCFQCYLAGLDRERALRAAGTLDTSSEARFQYQLPLEPVNRARLGMLKVERTQARSATIAAIGQYADRRRRAQIEARRALQAIAAGLQSQHIAPALRTSALDAVIHAAELQFPESWLPFVVSR
jgi:hypothetical protein